MDQRVEFCNNVSCGNIDQHSALLASPGFSVAAKLLATLKFKPWNSEPSSRKKASNGNHHLRLEIKLILPLDPD